MSVSGDRRIAVCATTEPALEALAELVRASDAGQVIAVHGWDPVALATARTRAHAYVLDAGVGAPSASS